MEGDVAIIADRPTAPTSEPSSSDEHVKKEQEKWDAWKANESLSRTEAKRRYIEKLIETMHQYASTTAEARELVEELEFVWDQIKNNSQHSSSEHSSPLQHVDRSGYLQNGSSSGPGMSSSGAAMERPSGRDVSMRVLSPVSQADEEDVLEEEREEFVDAPVSQIDEGELRDVSEGDEDGAEGNSLYGPEPGQQSETRRSAQPFNQRVVTRWRRRMESNLIKLTTEVAALREQLESSQYSKQRNQRSFLGWILRLSWWAVQLVVADAVLLWVVILYLRRKQDRRLEGAVRVLLGDAVAQVQKVGREVKMPTLPRMATKKTS